eukprot:GAHX01001537.1.p1 GENE.GAHX01001537.1~~GAHX01001537.1.p1  ORF type:complete len:205 (-),score=16.66 GAHX01001537.1:857-1471(-)
MARKDLSASEDLKRSLQQVKVSLIDASSFERRLQEEVYEKWTENTEIIQLTRIPKSDIPGFVNQMAATVQGIDDNHKERMKFIMYSRGNYSDKLVEFKYNTNALSEFRYGMIAFGHSPDGSEVDCMYIIYKMNFKIAPREEQRQRSILWGLISWTSTTQTPRHLESSFLKEFKNYFRLKALQGFCNEGYIDRINYVSSLEDVPE